MPDIGLFELLVIGVLLFVVVGPERMPEFFGQLGRWGRYGRDWWSQMRGEISREIDHESRPLKDMAGEMQQHIDGVRSDVEASVAPLTGSGDKAADDSKAPDSSSNKHE
ncbi:MAG: hypothetical protein R8L58_04645 [Mariprofundaceae bacterium]